MIKGSGPIERFTMIAGWVKRRLAAHAWTSLCEHIPGLDSKQ